MLAEQTSLHSTSALTVRECQRYVLEYEKLIYEIARLLSKHGGLARNLSPNERVAYHELVRRRNRAYHHVRLLERSLPR